MSEGSKLGALREAIEKMCEEDEEGAMVLAEDRGTHYLVGIERPKDPARHLDLEFSRRTVEDFDVADLAAFLRELKIDALLNETKPQLMRIDVGPDGKLSGSTGPR